MAAKSTKNRYFEPEIRLREDSAIPLHYQIAENIFKEIVKLRVPSGTCLATERVLSQKLGLNRSTVHKGYMKLLEDGVIRQRDNGRLYHVSESVSSKYKISLFPSLGIVMPNKISWYMSHSRFNTLDYLAGIMDEASESGFSTTFVSLPSPRENKERVREWAENLFSRLSGLIYMGSRDDDGDSVTELLLNEKSIPQIFLTGTSPLPHINSVLADLRTGLIAAVEHLRELEHENVGILSLKTSPGRHFRYISNDRPKVMIHAIKETGLRCQDKWISYNCDTEEKAGRELKRILSGKERPTAFLCHNDEVAANALRALLSEGTDVPGEISLIGYDDSRLASETVPQLTTVKVPRYVMGRNSVSLLLSLLKNMNNSKAAKTYVPTSLIVRGSTAKSAERGKGGPP